MNDLFGTLFDDGGLKVNPTENPQEDSKMFKPRFSKGQNKRYEAIIRFLPNPEDPRNKSIISKWSVFLKDPRTGTDGEGTQGREIDSPTTVGGNDPMTTMFFALRNAGKVNPIANKAQNNIKRHQKFYSLVQVIENASEPQTVGKILVWQYGPKIYEKIQTEMKPVMQGIEPNQPFDLFKGRLFKVIAIEQSGFNNLDQSMFFDIQYPANCMRIITTQTNAMGQPVSSVVPATKELTQSDEGRQAIVNFLSSNAPKLSQYDYHEWTPEQKNYVDEILQVHNAILEGRPFNAMQQNAVVNQMSMNQSTVPVQPQVSLGGVPGMGVTTPTPTPTPSATPSIGSILGSTTPTPTVPVSTPVSMPVSSPVSTATPTPSSNGLTLGADLSNLGAVPTTPQQAPNLGGVSGLNVNIDSIMGGATPTPTAAPVMNANPLGEILSDVMAQ